MGENRASRREKERESYVDRQKSEKTKNKLIAIAVIAAIVGIIAFAGYHYYEKLQKGGDKLSGPAGAGKLGGEHEHAAILVRIFGDKFNFALPEYQVKSPYIHFESQNGETIHRHAANVPLGFLFHSVKITLDDQCFIFPDKKPEHTFCTNNDYSLNFYVNHQKVPSIINYVIKDDDRVLVLYGNENQTQVDNYLKELDGEFIQKK
ncbi:MAG: protein-disulfide isomerase [Nitrosopumilaceae archaeon]|nr:protein-disulfide isomerase [Nitrosopumilaceae archaeon]NDF34767.1 protein-disulfide isomerase [Nitrosopumilaceae archaeon]